MDKRIQMFIHACVIALVLYLIMRFVLGQSEHIAKQRSIALGVIVLVYMLIFGHRLPSMLR